MDDSEMFMNFYDPHHGSPFHGMVASLIFTHRDQFYQALYEAIAKHPSYVVLSDLESEKKLKVLEGMIQYYEAKESYEKCATLLNIKKEIEEYVEN